MMGTGSSNALGEEVKKLGIDKVLVVTDTGVISAGLLKGIEASLAAAGVDYAIFDGVEPEPRYEIVEGCVAKALSHGAGMLVGVGGGSPMDITKVASVMLTNEPPLTQYIGVNLVPKPGLPTVLIPTTAGTGSEVTPIAILSDENEKLKKGIVSHYLYPVLAILDPLLTKGLPPHITAATGMDALIHAMEAFTSVNATGMTDMFCMRAIELLYNNIRIAFASGGNLDARSAMMEGAALAGIAFANAGVTAVHAFAYPIGAGFHIPHGIANSLMLPHVFRFNAEGNPRKFAQLAKPMGISMNNQEAQKTVCLVMDAIEKLIDDLKLPRHLKDYGVADVHVDELARDVLKVTRLLSNNTRTVYLKDAEAIYRAAL
jgi:alcohol dehydrogenase class IV